MAWIFVDKENEGESDKMRSHMRRNMRSGRYYAMGGHGGEDSYRDGYRIGYKHGWEDNEDEEMEHYRRQRDSRGRYV